MKRLLLIATLFAVGCAPAQYWTHNESGYVTGEVVAKKAGVCTIAYRVNGQYSLGSWEPPPEIYWKIPVGYYVEIYWWSDGPRRRCAEIPASCPKGPLVTLAPRED